MLEKSHISGFADEIDPSMDVQLALLDKLGVKYIEFRSGDGTGVADCCFCAKIRKFSFFQNSLSIFCYTRSWNELPTLPQSVKTAAR